MRYYKSKSEVVETHRFTDITKKFGENDIPGKILEVLKSELLDARAVFAQYTGNDDEWNINYLSEEEKREIFFEGSLFETADISELERSVKKALDQKKHATKLLVQKTDQEDPNSNYAVFVGYIFRD
jgi:hypothetical protein